MLYALYTCISNVGEFNFLLGNNMCYKCLHFMHMMVINASWI